MAHPLLRRRGARRQRLASPAPRCTKSPEFERQRSEGTLPELPLRYALTHHRAGIARSFAISALGSITYYVGITYVPSFLTSAGALPERDALWLSTVAAVIVILVTPFAGAWSDRVGRRPVLIVLALLSAVLPISMFSLMASGARSLGAARRGCPGGDCRRV